MEHPRGVVFHFSLFKIEVLRLVVRQARWQAHAAAVAVLVRTAIPTRWPEQKKPVRTLSCLHMVQNTMVQQFLFVLRVKWTVLKLFLN